MKILSVLTQYGARSLDRTFSYVYDGDKPVEPRFRVIIDFNGRPAMGFVLSVEDTDLSEGQLEALNGYKLKKIIDVVDEEPLLNDDLMALADEVASYYMAPKVAVLQAMLPKSLSPKMSSLHGPKIAYEKWVRIEDPSEEGLTAKQIEILRLVAANGEVLRRDLGSPSVVDKLIEANRISVFSKEKRRLTIPEEEREQPHEMSEDQKKAFETILGCPQGVVLLQGVTGSGKTEVYLRLSERILSEGKSVLMMVPEINLTPQMVEYFSRRFGNKIAILHSELTPGEKYDEYRRIAKGEAKVVVGARSAVFAPLSNIGLIVLDEEHVESYKQDNSPYYHAREVAIMRGKMHGCKVVLGSATPSLDTKARAMKGVYGYAVLPKRINEKSLPKATIVDLTDRSNYAKASEKLSKPLLERLKEKLDKGEQAILLINRRGYWTSIICPKCGHMFSCPSCGGSLTYHKEDQMLKCHHCGYVEKYPARCPECGCDRLSRTGYGTERVVKELEDIFPNIRVARLDSDVTKVSKKLEAVLSDFKAHKYDVLVGTEMVAKGHDFPDVTLSSVVLADIGLSLATYRASERTFELIAQAVGRSGRSKKEGVALIQTFNPRHYAVECGAKQDYEAFYAREMQQRKATQYPPFVYLFLLEFKASNEEKVAMATAEFKNAILSQGLESVKAIGPAIPYYSMIDGKYRRVLLIKTKKRDEVASYLKRSVELLSSKGGVDISIDVDPLDY